MRGSVKKKQDQIYRRDLKKKTEEEAKTLATMFFTHIVKPKPRLFPTWLWSAFFRLFVHVPKGHKPNFSRVKGVIDG